MAPSRTASQIGVAAPRRDHLVSTAASAATHLQRKSELERGRTEVLRSFPPWRRQLNLFIRTNVWFERGVFFVIAANCVTICFDNLVSMDTVTGSQVASVIGAFEVVFTVLFFIEMILKMVGRGIFVPFGGYFSTKVNIFDCVLVVFSTAGLIYQLSVGQRPWNVPISNAFLNVTSGGIDIAGLNGNNNTDGGRSGGVTNGGNVVLSPVVITAARAARLLRPIRTLNVFGSLRTVFDALSASLRRVVDILILTAVFTAFMALIALQFFRGSLKNHCFNVIPNDAVVSAAPVLPAPHNMSAVMATWGSGSGHGGAEWLAAVTTHLPDVMSSVLFVAASLGLSAAPSSFVGGCPLVSNTSSFLCALDTSGGKQGTICAAGSPESMLRSIIVTPGSSRNNNSSTGNNGTGGGGTISFVDPPTEFDVGPRISSGYMCEFGDFCLPTANPELGFLNFDNIFASVTTLFSVVVLEDWSTPMYYVIDAKGSIAGIYFMVVVLVGTIFILNLFLVVLTNGFTESLDALKQREAELKEEQNASLLRDRTVTLCAAFNDDSVTKEVDGSQPVPSASPSLDSRVSHTLGINHGEQPPLRGDGGGSVGVENEDDDPTLHSDFLLMSDKPATRGGSRGGDGGCWDRVATAISMWPCVSAFLRFRRASRRWIHRHITSRLYFDRIGMTASLVNAVVLSIIYEGMPESVDRGLTITSSVLAAYFFVEILVKMAGHRLTKFFSDSFNVFDFCVCVLAIIELFTVKTAVVSVFRCVRLLRLLRLSKQLRRTMKMLTAAIVATLPQVLLLFLTIFLIALLGVQLLGGAFCNSDMDSPYRVNTPACDNVPRYNFDNIFYAMVTIFVIFVGDGWRKMSSLAMSKKGDYMTLYFIGTVIIGTMIMVNLFVAVLIGVAQDKLSRSDDDDDDKAQEEEEAEGRTEAAPSTASIAATGAPTMAVVAASGGGYGADATTVSAAAAPPAIIVEASMAAATATNISIPRLTNEERTEQKGTKKSRRRRGAATRSNRPLRSPTTTGQSDDDEATTSSESDGLSDDDVSDDDGISRKRRGASQPRRRPPVGLRVSSASTSSRGSFTALRPGIVTDSSRTFLSDRTSSAIGAPGYRPPDLGTTSVSGRPRSRSRPDISDDIVADGLANHTGLRFSVMESPERGTELSTIALTSTSSIRPAVATPVGRGGSNGCSGNDDDVDGQSCDAASPTTAMVEYLDERMSHLRSWEDLDNDPQMTLLRTTAPHILRRRQLEFIESQKHVIRRVAHMIAHSTLFQYLTTVTIFFSMASLSLSSPLNYPDHILEQIVDKSDVVIAVVFSLEALLKALDLGLYHRDRMNYGKGYFQHRWNIFDFAMTLCSAFVAVVYLSGATGEVTKVADYLRFTRALRAWSLVGRSPRMVIIFQSLVSSLWSIGSVAFIALLVWVMFSIGGAQLFGGQLYACTSVDWGDQTYTGAGIYNKSTCLAQNYTWQNWRRDFDNVGDAMLTLFGVATTDEWMDVLFMTSSVSGVPDIAPSGNNRPIYVLFLMIYMVVMNFFLLNVFVSVLVDSFFETKKSVEKELRESLTSGKAADKIMSEVERRFFDFYQRVLVYVKPPIDTPYEDDSWRHRVRRVVRSAFFDNAVFIVAGAHIIVEATAFASEPPLYLPTLIYVDFAATIAFCVVTVLRIITYGLLGFLRQSWVTWVEIVVNVITLTATIGRLVFPNSWIFELMSLFRIFRLTRVFSATTGLRLLVHTLRQSAANFLAVLFVVFLIFYLFATLGMMLFGRVSWRNNATGIDDMANFSRIDLALGTLLRVATFDNWQRIMWDAQMTQGSRGDSGPIPCDENIGDCGRSPYVTVPFFFVFIFLGQWIGINCFTAVLLESFSSAETMERMAVKEVDVLNFRRLWKKVSGGRGKTMTTQQLSTFLVRLGDSSLGPRLPGKDIRAALRVMSQLDIEVHNNQVTQSAVFDALMRYFYGVPLPESPDRQLQREVLRSFRQVDDSTALAGSPTRQRGQSVSGTSVQPLSQVASGLRVLASWRLWKGTVRARRAARLGAATPAAVASTTTAPPCRVAASVTRFPPDDPEDLDRAAQRTATARSEGSPNSRPQFQDEDRTMTSADGDDDTKAKGAPSTIQTAGTTAPAPPALTETDNIATAVNDAASTNQQPTADS